MAKEFDHLKVFKVTPFYSSLKKKNHDQELLFHNLWLLVHPVF